MDKQNFPTRQEPFRWKIMRIVQFFMSVAMETAIDYMLNHVFVFNVLLSKEKYMKIVDIHKMIFSF